MQPSLALLTRLVINKSFKLSVTPVVNHSFDVQCTISMCSCAQILFLRKFHIYNTTFQLYNSVTIMVLGSFNPNHNSNPTTCTDHKIFLILTQTITLSNPHMRHKPPNFKKLRSVKCPALGLRMQTGSGYRPSSFNIYLMY